MYPPRRKIAPCARFVTLMMPKMSVKPLDTRKMTPARVSPLIVWTMNSVISPPSRARRSLALLSEADLEGGLAQHVRCHHGDLARYQRPLDDLDVVPGHELGGVRQGDRGGALGVEVGHADRVAVHDSAEAFET